MNVPRLGPLAGEFWFMATGASSAMNVLGSPAFSSYCRERAAGRRPTGGTLTAYELKGRRAEHVSSRLDAPVP